MSTRWATWGGRGTGTLSGVLLVGALVPLASGMMASPEYIDNPRAGVLVGAVGGLLGFGAGLWWDRRSAQRAAAREHQDRWKEVFADSPGTSASGEQDPVMALLEPSRNIVPFERGHLRFVTPIRRWCTDHGPGVVRLLAGGPGSGKTRVAMRVAEGLRNQLNSPWACGWLRTGPGIAAQAVTLAAGWPRPVLIIVDDAELRTDLTELLAAMHQNRSQPGTQVRLLLIAREFGGWWTRAQLPLRRSVDTAATSTWIGPIADDQPGQLVAAQRAVAAFARQLTDDEAKSPPMASLPLRGVQAGTPAILLHAAALEAVLQAADGYTEPVHVDDAVASLLDREQERWLIEAARQNLPHLLRQSTVLRDALVLATLVGAVGDEAADQLLRRVPGLDGAPAELIAALTTWLHLYGVGTGYTLRPHIPAVLAEYLAARALVDNPGLVSAVVDLATTTAQASYALAVLARAATHQSAALLAAENLIRADPGRLLPLAINQAQIGIGPLDHAIAAVISQIPLSWHTADSLYQPIKDPQEPLLRTGIALAHIRSLTAPDLPTTAHATLQYSSWLLLAGRYAEALPAARKAVDLSRELVTDDPDAHTPYLVKTLSVFAETLRFAGRYADAVTAAQESVDRQRAAMTATDTSDTRTRDLTNGLMTLGEVLRFAGRYADAATAAQEAVDLLRAFPSDTTNTPYLVNGLTTLGESMRFAGRYAEAVTAAREAVDLQRALATDNPDVQTLYLAQTLATLGKALGSVGRYAEAVTAAREAVDLQRELATDSPDAPIRSLADTLGVLAGALWTVGQYTEAQSVAREARDLYLSMPDGAPLFVHQLRSLDEIIDGPLPATL